MPQIVCGACGIKLKVPEQFTGRAAKCPRCAARISLEGNAAAASLPKSAARPAPSRPKPPAAEEEILDAEEVQIARRVDVASPHQEEPVAEAELVPPDDEVRPRKRKKKKRR